MLPTMPTIIRSNRRADALQQKKSCRYPMTWNCSDNSFAQMRNSWHCCIQRNRNDVGTM